MTCRGPWFALVVTTLFAACASELPFTTSFDTAGAVVVEVLGDGFVRVGERRMPLETFVLEARWKTRQMTKEERLLFAVHLRISADVQTGESARLAIRGRDRLLDELYVMGVKHM